MNNLINKTLNDPTLIKFGCVNADGRLNPQNIMRNNPFIMLKPIGLYGGLITVLQAIEIIRGDKRFFHVSKTDQVLASTISLDVLNGGTRVSASHCQEGQSEIVYNLEYIDLVSVVEIGGKKKRRTRKSRKSKRKNTMKKRKTRKSKRKNTMKRKNK